MKGSINKYYIYKIENEVNHKKYIGLTNNIQRRRNRHFTDLNCNRHDNSFMQKEFNIYGKNNLSFKEIFTGDVSYNEISDLEKKYIKEYDSYYNGYNQNEGGNFGPSNGGSHLIKSDILTILAVCEFSSRPGQILADCFDVTKTTISRIRKGINHCEVHDEYCQMPLEKRKEIFNIFCSSFCFDEKLSASHALYKKRKLSKEQCFMTLSNKKYRIKPVKCLAKDFNVQPYVLSELAKGNTYKDWFIEYNKLTETEQKYYASLLSNK